MLESHFGVGNGRFLLDDVVCTGSETSLDKCSHRDWRKHNCGASKAVGVVCTGQSTSRHNCDWSQSRASSILRFYRQYTRDRIKRMMLLNVHGFDHKA